VANNGDHGNKDKTGFISGENPFLPGDRDTTVPVTQCNELCIVTLYHTYPRWSKPSSFNDTPFIVLTETKFRHLDHPHLQSLKFKPCSPVSSHLDRTRLHPLIARVCTPCLYTSSHLDHPSLHPLIARICTPCWRSSSHLERLLLVTLIARVCTPDAPAHLACARLHTLIDCVVTP
jgi:hypothetical protein